MTIVEVPESLWMHVDAALVRLQAQFPTAVFRRCNQGIATDLSGTASTVGPRSAVMHAIYREKIYAETLPMREALLFAVMK
ncbi:MAG: hypothetical protein J0I31_21590 [Rhizobiales bacterium]|nr:hypothetical protein [Hyphomicrobiales bacterium]